MDNPELINTVEKSPLNQRVVEFLTAFAEEKEKQISTSKEKDKTLAMAQTARCYNLAAYVAQGDLTKPEVLEGLKKYGKEYSLSLDKKRQEAQKLEAGSSAKKAFETLEKSDPVTLQAILAKARFLNERNSFKDPATITNPAEKAKVQVNLTLATAIFNPKYKRPITELRDFFVYDRQRKNASDLGKQSKKIGETLEDLQKIVPRES